ncbi:4'-phosphopantetheinyl transferase [Photobacterium sp. OFAV2-7]|uniref:4'-phosphopantetheinyl transferase family protein n=1 Tax=Photobacterium sp. OFAV2-7 TaxID=2917748 RepID=UPI001EF5DE6E|nr:4'-phosphopantetheinyl transferase superfamily protein [Photobacterium sp. OFAV2-7]MCG7584764.1 4'-phosphopantetheinyl transferase superfamily protein [Photobacterium sp. OFAV2-7]
MLTPFISHISPVVIPDFVGVGYQCRFDPTLFTAQSAQQLDVEFPESLHRAVTKRQAEFIAGRYLAKRCLAALGGRETQVGIGQHRAPLWPEGMTGSISHSNNHAVCIVQPLEIAEQGIGIDIEQRMSDSTANSVKSTIINDAEYNLIMNHYVSFAEGLTAVFSAKESLFKALYPQVKAYFDFLDAEVVAMGRENLTLVLRKRLTANLSAGSAFTVHLQQEEEMVQAFTQS